MHLIGGTYCIQMIIIIFIRSIIFTIMILKIFRILPFKNGFNCRQNSCVRIENHKPYSRSLCYLLTSAVIYVPSLELGRTRALTDFSEYNSFEIWNAHDLNMQIFTLKIDLNGIHNDPFYWITMLSFKTKSTYKHYENYYFYIFWFLEVYIRNDVHFHLLPKLSLIEHLLSIIYPKRF